MRFTKLKLANWRNFRSVDIDLPLRVFLVGPNASGKSNLLDVFRFLRDVVSGGGFQKAVAERKGVSRIRCLAARQYPDIGIEVSMGNGEAEAKWRYSLNFTQDNNRNPIIVREEAWRGETRVLNRPDELDKADPLRSSQTALEQINANKDFREVYEFFQNVRYLHLVPQIIRRPEMLSPVVGEDDPHGVGFLDRLGRAPERIRNSRLAKIGQALKIAVPLLSELKWERDDRGLPHLAGRYGHWRHQGVEQREDQFSDGTLRLLGLLWSLLDGEGPLLLEEPELSLHSSVVRRLGPLIHRMQRERQRQVILSTHSADLLSDPGIGGEETFLLVPDKEGTEVRNAIAYKEVKALLEAGLSVGEAALPRTEPPNVHQLELFS